MCENCPVKCNKQCIAEKFNATNLCDKVNPAHPDYNPHYAQVIADKSCNTNEYKVVGQQGNEIARVPNDPVKQLEKHKMPSLWEQMKNLTSSMAEHAKDGFKNVSQEEYDNRLSICETCEFFEKDSKRCSKCGCFMEKKCWLRTASCPVGKWSQGIKKETEENVANVDNPEN